MAPRIEVPVTLWWPSDPAPTGDGRLAAWKAQTEGNVVERFIEGSHFSIMQMPTVRKLARQISAEMNAVVQGGGGGYDGSNGADSV